MERVFHYEDSKGLRQEEKLTAEQGFLDEGVLRDFGGLELAVSQGHTFNEINKNVIKRVMANVEKLPPNRALHWVGEMERIGAVSKEAPPAKPVVNKETSGGTK